MNARNFLPAAAVTAVPFSPALAHASQTFKSANDEIGVATHYAPGTLMRAQAEQDPAARVGAFGV